MVGETAVGLPACCQLKDKDSTDMIYGNTGILPELDVAVAV